MFPILEKPAGELDPVCGMTVQPQDAAGNFSYQSRTDYFCSKSCLAKFEHTCPMHPEVRLIGPGPCPKCGMALEPVTFSMANAEEVNPEYTGIRRRFLLSLPLALALLALMYVGPHLPRLEFALATPVVLWAGWPLFERGAAITLLQGDLRGILRARRLSQATMRNIRQNLFPASVYNTIGVPVAAGKLYPFFGLLLSPIIASEAMTLSSVSVIANAPRPRKLAL